MQRQTREYIDGWWSDLFGIGRDLVWRAVTVQPHALLGDYEGFFVAWREDGVHVSLPAGCTTEVARSLVSQDPARLRSKKFWHSFAASLDLGVIGPSIHAYLDVDPGPAPGVNRIRREDTTELRGRVSPEEWQESSFAGEADLFFGWHDDGALLAAANLRPFADSPRDIGVLVAPSARGQRLVDRVGRTAASYAIEHHDVARWCARTTNRGSLGAAHRLGFEPWCTQLAIR